MSVRLGGKESIMDGVTGRLNDEGPSFLNGSWSGIEGTDLVVTVDLKEQKGIDALSMGLPWTNGSPASGSRNMSGSFGRRRHVYRVRHGLSQRERRSAAADEDGHYRCKTGSGTVCPGLYQKTAGLPTSHPDNPGVATWIFFDELGITYTAVVEPPP